ncbi:MAG: hypothetical protein KJO32_16920 [Deltaproteobacteria bacterium]|nr:hypothetical protein [Deltaproteobacteria bacterium]
MKFHTSNYTVEIDLQSAKFGLHQNQIAVFEKRLDEIAIQDASFWDICSYRHGVLRYESETLMPVKTIKKKRKVLLVLGNPAILSVKNGMFFYSKSNGTRHGFWKKLAKAGLVKIVRKETRQAEAVVRRKMILEGAASDTNLIGLTTFYSFPTPGADNANHSGAAGVETLFEPFLRKMRQMESQRIVSYPFIDGSIVVFTQKSSLRHFYNITGIKPVYWPIRGRGSDGEVLGKLLTRASPATWHKNRLLQ